MDGWMLSDCWIEEMEESENAVVWLTTPSLFPNYLRNYAGCANEDRPGQANLDRLYLLAEIWMSTKSLTFGSRLRLLRV